MTPHPVHDRFRGLILGLTLAGLSLGVCQAQAPGDRSDLKQFQDSLAVVTDTNTLKRLEAATIDQARKSRDDPLLHLRLGLIGYRLGELTGTRDHYDDAGSEFEWATELEPGWPWPWYGLGRVELAQRSMPLAPSITINRLRKALQVDELSRAVTDFRRALTNDPAFAEAIQGLVEATILEDDRSGLQDALARARKAAGPAHGHPEYWSARASIERYMGFPDSSLMAAGRYLAEGGDQGTGLEMQAWASFDVGQPDQGRRQYDAALDHANTPAARAALRDNIAWIASDTELAGFDALEPDSVGNWVRRFWLERDLADARRPGARLAEHYRRLTYAIRHFRRRGTWWQIDKLYPYRSDQTVVDDRGVIYIRHGTPSMVAEYNRVGVVPNVSWEYYRPDTSLIFHFRPQGSGDGNQGAQTANYRLVESLLDISTDPDFVDSRLAMDPMYGGLLADSLGRRSYLERERGFRMVQRGTTTDRYVLTFRSALAVTVQRYGLLAEGSGRIVVSFAVKQRDLPVLWRSGDEVIYPVDLRLVAQAENGRVVALDTTLRLRAPVGAAAGDYLSGIAQLETVPGLYRLTGVITQPGGDAGTAQRWDSVAVPARGRPGLSDLVLGRPDLGIVWGSDSLVLNPLNAWPRAAAMTLYYEIAGLPAGSETRTTVEVVQEREGLDRLLRGAPRSLALSFEETTTAAPERVRRTLDLTSLEPGVYRLLVTVQPASGGPPLVQDSRFRVQP
ncbi:MAG: GWxTD domain-containing protein [Gemmatimonadales bacterium]